MNTSSHLMIKGMSPQFLVADMNRSIEFYTEKLGFAISFCYEDFYCGLTKDGHSIHFKLADHTGREKNDEKNNDDIDLLFSIEGIETVYEEIKSKAVTIVQPLREMPYGREFYIADPDDHVLAFFEEK